jgi:S-(hydroxymethyl)glutathione dehydrogenase / alcohol dehydrogenase
MGTLAVLAVEAAVFDGVGRRLETQHLELPAEPGPGEVLVKLAASGVCHSDYHVLTGDWAAPTPLVLGHEGAGVAEAVGSGVTAVAPGDRVILSWTPACGRCRYCVGGRPVLCDVAKTKASRHVMPDGTTRLRRKGEAVHSYIGLGTFGEYSMVTEAAVVPIRPDVPLSQAALVGCAVTTGVGAVINTAKVGPGASLLVIGCGGVGLSVIQGARLVSARPIIAIDRKEDKLEGARRFGATHVIDASRDEIVASVMDITHGQGVDYAFEAIGAVKTAEAACASLSKGGTAILIGQTATGQRISVDPLAIADRELSIKGCNYGSSRPLIDFPRILDLYMQGDLDLDAMITARIPLSEINGAFDSMASGEGIRSVIEFADGVSSPS